MQIMTVERTVAFETAMSMQQCDYPPYCSIIQNIVWIFGHKCSKAGVIGADEADRLGRVSRMRPSASSSYRQQTLQPTQLLRHLELTRRKSIHKLIQAYRSRTHTNTARRAAS